MERIAKDAEHQQGALTIFTSYFSGTGKTYRMLETARRMRQAGCDVVIGLLARNQWPQTAALAQEFEEIPRQPGSAPGTLFDEIALDACLQRKPQIILVDDLAHLNAEGSRHRNRYRDIEELLKAGIDVYTTLDIQHIESIQDVVSDIL